MQRMMQNFIEILLDTRIEPVMFYMGFICTMIGLFFLSPDFNSPAFEQLFPIQFWAVFYLFTGLISGLGSVTRNKILILIGCFLQTFVWTITMFLFLPGYLVSWGGAIATAAWILSLWFMVRYSIDFRKDG